MPTVTQVFPTEPFTASLAYEIDPTFRGLVDVWVRERRCPLPLVDLCLELDLPNAAECARWAATEPDRPTYLVPELLTGAYPWVLSDGRAKWTFERQPSHSHRIPDGCVSFKDGAPSAMFCDGVVTAILWLLDNWIVVKL